MRVPSCSPVPNKDPQPAAPEMLSITGTGVWRKTSSYFLIPVLHWIDVCLQAKPPSSVLIAVIGKEVQITSCAIRNCDLNVLSASWCIEALAIGSSAISIISKLQCMVISSGS